VVVNLAGMVGEITRSNKVESGVYGHVLWWNNNRVSSKNVTVIAWESNNINTWNADVTILWWQQNEINEGNGSRTAILVWWYHNRVNNSNEWVNIIWWKDNVIRGDASNVTILWGRENTVEWVDAIVWWSKVTVPSGVEDVFVFSEAWWAGLTSNSSGAFYLDLVYGLWINVVNNTTNWVEAWWAVWFGEIDINNNACEWSNYGLQWTWEGCLVWCTTKWWELLDTNEYCKNICKEPSNNCVDEDAVEPEPTEWFCEW
jgi:hypothetical protein